MINLAQLHTRDLRFNSQHSDASSATILTCLRCDDDNVDYDQDIGNNNRIENEGVIDSATAKFFDQTP